MKPATVFLGDMTNPEVEAFLKSHHTVIVPTGATEQHGPHAPLLTDEDVETFHTDSFKSALLKLSFGRFLRALGLETDGDSVYLAGNF